MFFLRLLRLPSVSLKAAASIAPSAVPAKLPWLHGSHRDMGSVASVPTAVCKIANHMHNTIAPFLLICLLPRTGGSEESGAAEACSGEGGPFRVAMP